MAMPKTKATKLPAKTWHAEALRLHVAGWSVAHIATQIGQTSKAVREAIHAEIDADIADSAEEIKRRREVKSAQLDAVIRGSMIDAEAGVPAAAAVVTAAVKEQIKLHGLAAPERVEMTGKLTLSFDAREELIARIDKQLEAVERAARAATDAAAGEAGAADPEPGPG